MGFAGGYGLDGFPGKLISRDDVEQVQSFALNNGGAEDALHIKSVLDRMDHHRSTFTSTRSMFPHEKSAYEKWEGIRK
jgi:hypothetical protein